MASKKAMEMNADETRKFVELYIGNECLWNPLSAIYSRRDFRLAATRRIISEMGNGMTEEQVAKKIACLRTCYARELKKLIEFQEKAKMTDDFDFSYKPKWQFFEMLDPYLRPSVLQNSSYFNNMDCSLKDDSSNEKEGDKHQKLSDELVVNGTTAHINSICTENPQNNILTIYTQEKDFVNDANQTSSSSNQTHLANLQKPSEFNEALVCSGDIEDNIIFQNTKNFKGSGFNNVVTSPVSPKNQNNSLQEPNGALERTITTKKSSDKHKNYASPGKSSPALARDIRKRKADNLESTVLGVRTHLENKISNRTAERKVGVSLTPNPDEIFAQHLANLMQKVPERKSKWEMQLRLQQTILEYIPD